MKKHYIKLALVAFILMDLIVAFLQYVNFPIDGDLYAIVLPAPWYAEVLNDPFGWEAVKEGKDYGGAGRYTAHWIQSHYFKTVPFLFQWFVDPIQSIYYSAASFKILMHIGLIFITASYICGHLRFKSKEFILSACAVIPLIHTYGLYNRIGLIDRSITYVFFYIFPFLLLLMLLFPFYQYFINKRKPAFTLGWFTIPWLFLAFCVAFFGPMIQSLMMLSGGMIILSIWINELLHHERWRYILIAPFNSNRRSIGVLSLCLILFGGTGYMVGLQNVENISSLPITETIQQAFKGISFHYFESWHFWVWLVFLALHLTWMFKHKDEKSTNYRLLYFFLFGALIIYMSSLPLGGYRSYRPMIYRYDLLIPVTWSTIFILLSSGRWMIQQLNKPKLKLYIPFAVIALMIFWIIDLPIKDANACEMQKLGILSESQQDSVVLGNECTVLSWELDDNYYFTEKKVKLLQYWGIVEKDISYIQKTGDEK